MCMFRVLSVAQSLIVAGALDSIFVPYSQVDTGYMLVSLVRITCTRSHGCEWSLFMGLADGGGSSSFLLILNF